MGARNAIALSFNSSSLAAVPVAIAVEAVGVTPANREVAVGDVAAVQIRGVGGDEESFHGWF